jgi:acyl-CoA thioesterase-1
VLRFIVVLLASLAAACSSNQRRDAPSSATSEPAAQTQTNAAPDHRKIIAAFGDSLTAGFGAEPGRSYPDYLQKDIDAQGYPWRVVNLGVSGATSSDGLERISEVIAQKPSIVILELGANDGLRGIPVQRMRDNLEQMISALQQNGAKVVLAGMTLPPNYGPDYIKGFESSYQTLSKKYRLTLIPFLLQGVAGNAALMQQDGLHPNAEGNRIVAENVMRTIHPLLR